MKRTILTMLALAAATTAQAALSVEVDTVVQNDDRTVDVGYTLSGGPAVVTFAVETNGPNGWVKLDGRHCARTTGDVFCKVAKTAGAFTWTPDESGIDRALAAGALKVTLTAWAPYDTPDYMVVSLENAGYASAADRIHYYTTTNEFPGGLLANPAYRSTKLVMKRVKARGIPWTMGSIGGFEPVRNAANEIAHQVILDHDYYLGVFPLTSAQVSAIFNQSRTLGFTIDHTLRIADRMNYSGGIALRGSAWPAAPASDSIVGNLRALTAGEIDDWDLPGEAEWEFAAKAGQPYGFWNDGTEYAYTDNNTKDAGFPGRYRYNQETDWWTKWQDYSSGGAYGKSTDQPVGNGCPIAGSYAPNAWGFYDMLGGIWERCNDWYQEDVSTLGGAVNVNLSDSSTCIDGTLAPESGKCRVIRGGCYISAVSGCRVYTRSHRNQTYGGDSSESGGRVCCRLGL